MNRRILSLTPLMLALALAPQVLVGAEDVAGAGVQRAATVETSLAEAQALYRDARFAEALVKVDEVLRLSPGQPDAIKLRQDVQAVLGNRQDRLTAVADWAASLQDVQSREVAVRIRSLIESGDRAHARGDYAAAELDYDRAEVSLRTFPYNVDWGDLPTKLAGKRAQAREQARAQALERDNRSREAAEVRAQDIAQMQEDALAAKVDELMGRAREAYGRKDFRRAELDAWNAYELDRRREDARKLYLESRREGHVLFDERHEDERLERIARVNEEIYRSLIPQSEVLVYPEDWQRRSLRKPRELSSAKEEAWVAALKASLEIPVTFDFKEKPFDEVVDEMRRRTGVNIIVAPTVLAKGGGLVNLTVSNMKFSNFLKLLMGVTNLKMAFQNQAIFVSDADITGAVTLKLYDVADLIQSRRDFPGRELAFTSGGSSNNMFAEAKNEGNKPPSPDELVEFVKKNVTPQAWANAESGFGITQRGGATLFISATPEAHVQIDQVLTSLRNQDSLQVKVDIRLLDVRKNYFEELGVEWNQGNLLPVSNSQGYSRENENSLVTGNINNLRAMPDNDVNFNQLSGSGFRGLQLQGTMNAFNYLGTDQVSMILTAVENEMDIQQLYMPTITCFNGQRANASFVTQFAYIKTYEVVSSNLDPRVETLSFGNLIDIRPVVSSDRKYVMMEVKPTSVDLVGVWVETLVASRVLGGTSGGGGSSVAIIPGIQYVLELPNVEVRGLRSTVMMPDKGSMLLGGFQSSTRQRTHVGVPFLSHIPFLGRLFGRNGSYDRNRKLFYMLHAEILNLNETETLQ